MIYEARPNVTYDVFSLCFKSGNACVLKGGRDANASNSAGVELIHRVLIKYGVNPNVCTLLPAEILQSYESEILSDIQLHTVIVGTLRILVGINQVCATNSITVGETAFVSNPL